uniref:Uncharacterized protein n=1 Tax=Fagus sylvatica TaxID=28930 RepID=A0A2N9E4L0_FAGSY
MRRGRAARLARDHGARPSGAQNGSCVAYLLESSRRLLSNDIKFVRIGVQEERVMAPGSWGARAIFRAGKTLRAKAVVQGENASDLQRIFPYFLSVFARIFDLAPEVSFRRSWYHRKACATLSLKVLDLQETGFGFARYGSANRGHWSVFGPSEAIFPIEIPARPGKFLTIREFHVVSEHVLFPTYPGLWINSLGELGFAKIWSREQRPLGMFLIPGGHFLVEIPAWSGGALDDPRVARRS